MDIQEQPFFSIITVTFNAQEVLPPTISSIKAQSCHDYEWIVQDGASADNTVTTVTGAGVPGTRLWSEPDGGLYDAMNRAAAKARGRYLVWLNAGDCFADADALKRLKCAAASDDPGVIYGQTQLVDSTGRVVGMRHLAAPRELSWRSFSHGMLVCHQAFLARRDLFVPYDLRYRFSADFDWCIRILKQAQAVAYAGDRPVISFLSDGGLTARNHRASLGERYRIMCHYYGTLPTILHHIGFIPRYVMRRLKGLFK